MEAPTMSTLNTTSVSDIYTRPLKVAFERISELREENERLKEAVRDMRFHLHLAVKSGDPEDRLTAIHDALDVGYNALEPV
jgi:hypothetical protein